jgi:hypothetical protein
LPGGSRITDGSFISLGSYGSWWSATETTSASNAYYWGMGMLTGVGEGNGGKDGGLSVRCLQD